MFDYLTQNRFFTLCYQKLQKLDPRAKLVYYFSTDEKYRYYTTEHRFTQPPRQGWFFDGWFIGKRVM